MRIWDIAPKKLCRNHLLGEHRELHAIWSVLTKNKKGYSRHPETLRWKGKLKALYIMHRSMVEEMGLRGYKHHSDLPRRMAVGKARQTAFVDSYKRQVNIIKRKECGCKI